MSSSNLGFSYQFKLDNFNNFKAQVDLKASDSFRILNLNHMLKEEDITKSSKVNLSFKLNLFSLEEA